MTDSKRPSPMHTTKVTYERAGYWRAVCSCGWKGVLSPVPGLAQHDEHRHGKGSYSQKETM